jgi:hypothetical protein
MAERVRFIPRHPKGTNGSPNNGRGIHQPWIGTWGVLGDRRSKLSKRAKKIEAELVEVYDTSVPRVARLVKKAAQYEALEEMSLSLIGREPKMTTRAARVLTKRAASCLAQVEALGARRVPKLPTIGGLITERAAGGGHRR